MNRGVELGSRVLALGVRALRGPHGNKTHDFSPPSVPWCLMDRASPLDFLPAVALIVGPVIPLCLNFVPTPFS